MHRWSTNVTVGTSFYENEDSLTISSISDNNIFVIDKNKLNFNDLNYAKNQIYSNNGKILGFILNKTNIKLGTNYRKSINSKFGINIEDTLSNLYKTKKYILQTQIPNLYILQNGTITVNSSELLKSDKPSTLSK